MAMRKYTLTDLGNKSGEVVEAAYGGPVDITSRGKRKFVLMTADLYDRLAGQTTQTAHAIDTMTEAEVDELLAGLDALIDQADHDD
jgi:antitoxin Phd